MFWAFISCSAAVISVKDGFEDFYVVINDVTFFGGIFRFFSNLIFPFSCSLQGMEGGHYVPPHTIKLPFPSRL